MDSCESNVMVSQPTNKAVKISLPDELIVRMAHEAGWLEAKGQIKVDSWEDLQVAIRDAIEEYYNEPNEKNPFVVEDVLDSILLERFPPEQDKSQKSSLTAQIQAADAKKPVSCSPQSSQPIHSI